MRSALISALEVSTLREAAEAAKSLSAGGHVTAVGDPFGIDHSLERTYAIRANIVGTRNDAESRRLLLAMEEFVANLSRNIGVQAQWLRIGVLASPHFLCCISVLEPRALGCIRVGHARHAAEGNGTSAA